MSANSDRVVDIFNQARGKPPGEDRQRFLEEACRHQPEWRAEIDSMLRAYDAEAPGEPLATTRVVPELITEKPGDRIDRYKLLEKIGEGGMGAVWMAEQTEPVRRRVALKLIKQGMDSNQVLARFEAERQALALMDHPHIAKVLDAGATATGRPYFVMELVKGIPLTKFCDDQRLSIRERLELFVPVCQAIQHAHQKGIIHRDIKPSNVLVAMYDGVPVPKVIDFGVAKAIGQQLTERTIFTGFGAIIGTLEYMSPEQAEFNQLDIDTRSDIYSLGVLLYELLTGSTPITRETIHQAAFDEVIRRIREEEPPRPSTRLSESKDLLPSISAQRQLDSPKLRKLVRGDLDWIVMKCLEKDRRRRYETANGLAMDVERYFNNEPVTAAAPTAFYKLQKFARRNQVALATAATMALVLVAAAVVSTWQALRAARAEKAATTEGKKHEQVAQFLKDMIANVGPSVALGRDTAMLREILDKTAERVGKDLKDQPEVESDLRAMLGATYYDLGLYSQAEAMDREALRLRRSISGNEHRKVASLLNNLATVFQAQGNLVEAEKTYRESLALSEKLFGAEHLDVVMPLGNLATVIHRQGKSVEAEKIQRRVLAMQKKNLGAEHMDIAVSLNNLALTLKARGQRAEAETMLRESLAMSRKLRKDDPFVANQLHNLAEMIQAQGQLAEAEAMHREGLALRKKVYGNEHVNVIQSLGLLSVVFQDQGKQLDAETAGREALAIARKAFGNEHSRVATQLSYLGALLGNQDKLADAETTLREALAITRKVPTDQAVVADIFNNLGVVLEKQHKLVEGEAMRREALASRRRLHGNEHIAVAEALDNLAPVLREQDKLAEAATIYNEARAIREKLLGPEHPDVAATLKNLFWILWKQGNQTGALAVVRGGATNADPSTRKVFSQPLQFMPGASKAVDPPSRKEFNELLHFLTVGSTKALPAGISVMVNARPIRDAEIRDWMAEAQELLRRTYKANPAEYERHAEQLKNDATDALIERALILGEADRMGWRLNPQAVQEHFDDHIRRRFNGDTNTFLKALTEKDETLPEFRKRQEEDLLINSITSSQTKDAANPTTEQIERYYNTNLNQFVVGDQVKLRMVVLSRQGKSAAEFLGMAREIVRKLEEGTPFAEMAAAYSQSSQGKARGDWGWIDRGVLKKGLSDVAFDLQSGQRSEIIGLANQGKQGYYLYQYNQSGQVVLSRKYANTDALIEERKSDTAPADSMPPPQELYLMLVEAKRNARTKPLSEVHDEIQRTLYARERSAVKQRWLNALRADAIIRRK